MLADVAPLHPPIHPPLADVAPLHPPIHPPLADVAPLRQLADIQPRRNPKRSLQLPRQTFLRQPR